MAIDKVLRGIPFLRQELTKIFMKRAADKSGIMQIPFKNQKLQLDIEDRLQKYILDAQKQGVDLDMVSNENLKYTVNLNENVNPLSRAISADSPEGRRITEMLLGKRGEVVDMAGKKIDTSQGIMGGKSVAELMESGQVTKGARGMKKSKKVQDREMFENSNLNKTDAQIKAEIEASNKKSLSKMETNNFALNTITKIKSMSPMDAMKEANLVAGKKGKYSNLDNNQVKKIIDDTEDHIFERDIPEEDFATGGRAGFKSGLSVEEMLNEERRKKGVEEDPLTSTNTIPNLLDPKVMSNIAIETGLPTTTQKFDTGSYFKEKLDYPSASDASTIKSIQNFKRNPDPDLRFTAPEISDFMGVEGIFKGLNPEQVQSIYDKVETDDPYADIEGQTAFLDPISAAIGIGKLAKGAKASTLAKQFLRNKARQKITTPIFDKAMKKINTPKYPQGPSKIKTGGGGGKSLYDSGSNYRSVDSSGNKVTSKSAAGTTTFDSKSGKGRRDYADGGITRANFVGGGMGRRGFLKMLAGLGGGIAAAKTGLLKLAGKEPAKQVAKEVAQQTTSSMPPPYFFKLAEKIKMMGDDVTATTDRTIAKKLKSKDGKSEYLLEEDLATGDTSIKKIYKEDDNMITDVEIMELRKGEVVQTKDGKAIKTPDEYEEVTEVNKRIYKDDYNASDYTDGINVDEIIKEVGEQAPSIKKASGGIARMLGE